ncbi:1-deoxy-D-xylulose-5-phosphate synthase [Bifidobacterium sp. SMB2]|uniref:1-deoxy-D-xylulose-5-phosphate synthase n=1 Tax=Bifidobacterium saimiriisciurei TaxID=2661627 RepID=A0ABX0C8Y3_9BIFI|nr:MULTISPECIES: 1-deoxy-D-xylulose-5-phosphate synthase [Bifidobacterium]NEG96520.1 1-deoxy-D-xylulose-5-phosphate synthase [Bifidobacterium sp. SMB2]NEH10563.1 1-deoxy-D-xylulose-5-phosphate synthase [Bifidobacterium saimiriisciurei]NEH10654.1 1-deoxy-D-xylulose-5-phosphate synthase [Bifidobacterium saimiriisciurei]
MSDLLAHIDGPDDLKRLYVVQLPALADEIRAALLRYCAAKGGHIGSNLGMVEATIALHYVFDSPRDRIVFDVSHQSYVHKMLTGRRLAFTDETLFGSATGFTNPDESEHDSFVLGHTGTSVSLACGMAKARDLMGGRNNVIAVIGDGSLSSAVAFEGLNEAAELNGNLIIVFNDNEMSIAENHGGMYAGLAELRATNGTSPHNLFRDMGLDYRYVADGNDTSALVQAFEDVKDCDHATVVHIHTLKGKGLDAAEEGRVESNHWHNPVPAAEAAPARPNARKTYGGMAMDALAARFDAEPGLVVISPATPGSNGITRQWRAAAGRHYIDTGITEEHAVTFAAGIARAGGTPVLATSATFFQRAYDEIHQEFALNNVPGTLLVFSGGISGTDNTHSGAGDVVMFGNVPGLTCLAPTSGEEMLRMLAWATGDARRPVAIRMPGEAVLAGERGGEYPRFVATTAESAGAQSDVAQSDVAQSDVAQSDVAQTDDGAMTKADNGKAGDAAAAAGGTAGRSRGAGEVSVDDIAAASVAGDPWARYTVTRAGSQVAILGLGNAYPLAEKAAASLDDAGVRATVIDPHQYSTIDTATLDVLRERHTVVVTVEDGQLEGGWGGKIASYYGDSPMRVLNFGARKEVTDRIPLDALCKRYRLTAADIADAALKALHG